MADPINTEYSEPGLHWLQTLSLDMTSIIFIIKFKLFKKSIEILVADVGIGYT